MGEEVVAVAAVACVLTVVVAEVEVGGDVVAVACELVPAVTPVVVVVDSDVVVVMTTVGAVVAVCLQRRFRITQ